MHALEIKNKGGKLLTYKQTAEASNLGITAVMRIAKESNALLKIGKSARVDWDIFYDYIVEKYRVKKMDGNSEDI